MFLHYLKIAWRNLLSNNFRYLFTALSLAVGMVVVTFTLYMIFQEYRTFTQFEHHDRIAEPFIVSESGRSYTHQFQFLNRNMLNGFLQHGSIPGIEKIGLFFELEGALNFEKGEGSFFPYTSVVGQVNKEFFDVFSAQFISGNCNRWNEDEAIIMRRFAEKVYGEENPVGKSVQFNNRYYQITGVIEGYSSPGIVTADLYIPIPVHQRAHTYVLLDENADIGLVSKYLNDKQVVSEDVTQEGELEFRIISKNEYDTFQKVLYALIIIIASLVLLAALINSLNLSISSLLCRNREVILRKTMGAPYKSIWITAILTDLFVLAFALLMAASLSELLIGFINSGILSLNIKNLWIESYFVFLFLIGVFAGVLIGTVIFISVATYRIVRIATVQGFQSSLHRGNRRGIRNALLVVQLSICFLFIGITLGLHLHYTNFFREYNQSMNNGNKDSDRILKLYGSMSGSRKLMENRDAIMTELEQIKEVEKVMRVPFYSILPRQANIKLNQEDDDESAIIVSRIDADKHYFSFFGLKDPDNSAESNDRTVFINDALAQILYDHSFQNSFYVHGQLINVSDVINDLPFVPNDQPGFLEIDNSRYPDALYFKCAPGKMKSVQQQITDIIYEYEPEYPFRMETFKEEINIKTNYINRMRDIFLLLGVISLIISMFGIYSAIVTDTQRRQKEVAIRKVNGAQIKDILRLFGKLYAKLLVMSLIIAAPFFLSGLRFIGMIHGQNVSVWDLPFWLGLITIVSGFVFITVIWRMWRTARVNPATILKKE